MTIYDDPPKNVTIFKRSPFPIIPSLDTSREGYTYLGPYVSAILIHNRGRLSKYAEVAATALAVKKLGHFK